MQNHPQNYSLWQGQCYAPPQGQGCLLPPMFTQAVGQLQYPQLAPPQGQGNLPWQGQCYAPPQGQGFLLSPMSTQAVGQPQYPQLAPPQGQGNLPCQVQCYAPPQGQGFLLSPMSTQAVGQPQYPQLAPPGFELDTRNRIKKPSIVGSFEFDGDLFTFSAQGSVSTSGGHMKEVGKLFSAFTNLAKSTADTNVADKLVKTSL